MVLYIKFYNQQVPTYAHHTVGVGGFVVNEKDELLVIEERFRFQDKPHWKLPGGKYHLLLNPKYSEHFKHDYLVFITIIQ